ncbi:MAG: hypothetical protein MUF18_15490 [Fimbriiglobus sp.]|nr:hypothetical protein [Fimbriiglobus sp.]
MTPILRQLKSWQAREWLYSASVAVAAVALVALFGVALACTVDNLWDLNSWDGTPFWARLLMTVGQLALYLGAVVFAVRSVKAPSLVSLASRAEAEFTEYDHRLVTTLQLNREGARTAGMSKELISAVTDEALGLTARRKLASLADPKRLLWAGGMLLPVALAALAALLLSPQTSTALLLRQLLLPVDIPRNVAVENASEGPFPAGDPIQVRVRVTGPADDRTPGEVRVTPEGGERAFKLVDLSDGVRLFHTVDGTARYPLRYAGPTEDGTASYFVADLPPATEPFRFDAKVGDGRTKAAAELRYEPRPVVTKVDAWILAPAYVDPDGQRRFTTAAKQGEIVCHPDCAVKVQAEVSKTVKRAEVVLSGRAADQRVRMTLDPTRTTATATFAIPPGVNGYRVEVTDDYNFANLSPPRRGISVLPDRPPTVVLNDELLMPGWETGPPDDYEVRGMPLVLGGQIQISYQARSSLGIARAAVIYRVNDGPWTLFSLKPVSVDAEKVGRFRPELGVFETYDETKNNELYLVPASDPEAEPGGLVAGGRYNFLTAALVKTAKDGTASKLAVGDRVEFRIAAYDRKHEVMERGRAVAGELLRLIETNGATADKAKEFLAVPLPETPVVQAAREAVAANPKTAAPALKDLLAALKPEQPIAMTDTDLAARPADERVGQGRPAGYSESRLKAVVTDTAFKQWQEQQARSRERLRELEKAQQGVFGEKKR